jgi:hypothetical protein
VLDFIPLEVIVGYQQKQYRENYRKTTKTQIFFCTDAAITQSVGASGRDGEKS